MSGLLSIKNFSLRVEAGDIFGFIGHNGAGKSTTIRAVVGVLDFEEGEILIDGHDVKKEPLACKQVTAYIPDNPDLYEHLTGIQYLNFIADIFGVPAAIREEKIKKSASAFAPARSCCRWFPEFLRFPGGKTKSC
jgi:ABC-2 type transport system ATP-binding protein